MQDKSYEDKINEIKNYLKQKEKEVENNKINHNYNDFLKFDDDYPSNNTVSTDRTIDREKYSINDEFDNITKTSSNDKVITRDYNIKK